MNSIRIVDPALDSRWDEFVTNHPYGWLCHLGGWKKVLEESFPHMKGHYLALISPENMITAALPLVEVRSWLTGHRLVSLPFATLCDPLIQRQSDFDLLVTESIALAGRLGAPSVSFRTHQSPLVVSEALFDGSRSYKHHFLSLEPGPDALLKSFDRTNVRQRLKRAEKSSLTLMVVEHESELAEFYRLYVLTRKRLGLPPHPYRFIRSLWTTFAPSGGVEILMAGQEGRVIAAVLLLKFRDRVSVEYSVHDERYRKDGPVQYLFWEAMKMSHAAGYRIFDLGRTDESNKSLMDFKNRWGMQVVDLPEFHFPRVKPTMKQQGSPSVGYRIMRNVCRYTPAVFLPALGKLCYRHLG